MYFPHPSLSCTILTSLPFPQSSTLQWYFLSISSSHLGKFFYVWRNRNSSWKLLLNRIYTWLLTSKTGNLDELCYDNIHINSVTTGKHRTGEDSGYILETIQSRLFRIPSSEIKLLLTEWSSEEGATLTCSLRQEQAKQPNPVLPTEAGPTNSPYLIQPCLITNFYQLFLCMSSLSECSCFDLAQLLPQKHERSFHVEKLHHCNTDQQTLAASSCRPQSDNFLSQSRAGKTNPNDTLTLILPPKFSENFSYTGASNRQSFPKTRGWDRAALDLAGGTNLEKHAPWDPTGNP